jgi:hypothetical protein|tara:strand:+ start:738 stop:998 length:261 start_codon:yes stop_codon:yes gene_type:complete
MMKINLLSKPKYKPASINIEVGTHLDGVWGAMIPISEGHVVGIAGDIVSVHWNENPIGDTDCYNIKDIHKQGFVSVNGSPIGVFIA